MAVNVYIIAGFLGAGKTTLMKHMVEEVFQEEKVVIIENDFGDVNVDAALLNEYEVEVSALSAGCICCSLSGNFIAALDRMIKKYHPTVVLVEPSGVAKLSDIQEACRNNAIKDVIEDVKSITVVDMRKIELYKKNYGEFYEDQLVNAQYIWMSHMEGELSTAHSLLKKYGVTAEVSSYEKMRLPKEFVTWMRGNRPEAKKRYLKEVETTRKQQSKTGRNRPGSFHTQRGGFQSTTVNFQLPFSLEQIKEKFKQLDQEDFGTILRVKGVLQSKDGYYEVQYLPGELKIEPVKTKGNSLVFIGENLRRNKLHYLFRGGI